MKKKLNASMAASEVASAGHRPERTALTSTAFATRPSPFAALADPTRRGVLDQLARGDASISDLAERFDMTLTGKRG